MLIYKCEECGSLLNFLTDGEKEVCKESFKELTANTIGSLLTQLIQMVLSLDIQQQLVEVFLGFLIYLEPKDD